MLNRITSDSEAINIIDFLCGDSGHEFRWVFTEIFDGVHVKNTLNVKSGWIKDVMFVAEGGVNHA